MAYNDVLAGCGYGGHMNAARNDTVPDGYEGREVVWRKVRCWPFVVPEYSWVWPSLDKCPAKRAAIFRSCRDVNFYRVALLVEIYGGERTHGPDGEVVPVPY